MQTLLIYLRNSKHRLNIIEWLNLWAIMFLSHKNRVLRNHKALSGGLSPLALKNANFLRNIPRDSRNDYNGRCVYIDSITNFKMLYHWVHHYYAVCIVPKLHIIGFTENYGFTIGALFVRSSMFLCVFRDTIKKDLTETKTNRDIAWLIILSILW